MRNTYSEEQAVLPKAIILRWFWRISIAILVFLVLGLAWLVAFGNLFTSGSDLGYNLGLAGGLLMLSMLLYPLRKRVRVLEPLGRMESWFRYHMFIGIGAPLLILFHSTFKIGSMNSRIALYSMLLVALSGIVGRFVYRHIHRGLYGKELTLVEAEAMLNLNQQNIGSVFSLNPEIEQDIKEFQEYVHANFKNPLHRAWRFMVLRHKGKVLSRKVRHKVKKTLAAEARSKNWPKAQIRLNYVVAKDQVDDYIDAIIQHAQLASWLKLFSLWHVAHIPFLYLLLFSGIAHVIAAHLY